MSRASSLRIAILAHSTNPRGGVVHALELADALVALGHEAVVHAPDSKGKGFFRRTACGTVCVPASPVGADTTEMVQARIGDYVRHFENKDHRQFDVFHAQDGISGNALVTLKERGLIQRIARTVHHVDHFESAALMDLQARAIRAADMHFAVSRKWRDWLAERFGVDAKIIGNGVDMTRFHPRPDDRDRVLRKRLGLGRGPVVLCIGGIEARKNTIASLESFQEVRRVHPDAQLIIAGGASLLDHGAYQQGFADALASSGLAADAVIHTGPLAQDDMPALYRIADVLAFPSLKEGFGLVVIEAMTSGVPVIVSQIAPFTEYLRAGDVAWCDPHDTASIARAILAALCEPLRGRLIAAGLEIAPKHDWRHTARAHLAAYERLTEESYA